MGTFISEELKALFEQYGGAEGYANYLYDNTVLGTIEGFSVEAAKGALENLK